MRALILAAGYGTRLYPYTKNLPKPLLKVDKKPLINYLIEKILQVKDTSKIIVVTNERFFKHFLDWRETISVKNQIAVVNDLTKNPRQRLGAVGDMNFVFSAEESNEDFLVLGGDNFFKESLVPFVCFARSKRPYATIGVFDIQDKSQLRHYGVVSLDRNSCIRNFEEKPLFSNSSLVAMCLYYFPAEGIKLLKEYSSFPKQMHDAAGSYIKWLAKKSIVYGFVFKKLWCDIGRIQTYNRLKRELKKER